MSQLVESTAKHEMQLTFKRGFLQQIAAPGLADDVLVLGQV